MQPDFPAAVQAVAEQDARAPHLPDLDLTHLEFVTVDPAGAMDLDQAMHLEADGDGYVVHYAIADVHAFVAPGDAVDVEAHARGESLYGAEQQDPAASAGAERGSRVVAARRGPARVRVDDRAGRRR